MAGTLENYSVSCELAFLLGKLKAGFSSPFRLPLYPPCAQNILTLVHIPSMPLKLIPLPPAPSMEKLGARG